MKNKNTRGIDDMKIQEKMRKPMLEAKYLNVENTDRYRPIIRLFYLKYEKLKYWMYQEEVFEELKEDPYFQEYTMEQCQQDLAALASWGNLLTIQDTRKVTTIEEFKNKKFRYQLSETAVEVERMVIRIENLLIEGSSLEPTLLERLRISLGRLGEMSQAEAEKRYGWWNDLNSDFIRLNQNYQDYMRELNSVKAEEMMKTKEFLVFKDRLIEYLRSFVKSLQVNVTAIEQQLRSVDREVVNQILQKVTEYELSIPRMDTEIDEQMIYDKMKGRWESISEWFAGKDGMESEAGKVLSSYAIKTSGRPSALRATVDKEVLSPDKATAHVTILRAVHKYKDSREQFEQRTHKRLIDITSPSQKTVDALSRLEMPAGVFIDIKMKNK